MLIDRGQIDKSYSERTVSNNRTKSQRPMVIRTRWKLVCAPQVAACQRTDLHVSLHEYTKTRRCRYWRRYAEVYPSVDAATVPMYTEGGVTAWLIMRTRCYHWFSLQRVARVYQLEPTVECVHITQLTHYQIVYLGCGSRSRSHVSLRAEIKSVSNPFAKISEPISKIRHSRTKFLRTCFLIRWLFTARVCNAWSSLRI